MVEMDLETVAAELGRRFAAELPEFYQRRVIFWIDPDREFADRLQELSIPGVTVLVRTGRNEFALKKRICADEQKTNFLVYCPFTPARPEDDWLLNVELCSESFRADRVSLWMEEMGLPEGAALRTAFTQYRKFFNAKDRRARAARLVKKARTPEGMRLAVLASLAGAAEASPNAVTEAVLRGGLKEEQNRAWQNFLSYGAKEDFCAMAAAMYGWDTESDGTLTGLAKYLLFPRHHRPWMYHWQACLWDGWIGGHTAMISLRSGSAGMSRGHSLLHGRWRSGWDFRGGLRSMRRPCCSVPDVSPVFMYGY